MPWYRKAHSELDSHQLELLARQALRISSPTAHCTIKRLDQERQSISWLRLVHGQWLLVASRHVNTKISTLSLYSVTSLQKGRSEPLIRVELVGPVSSGEVEVQDRQLVVALCFQVPYVSCVLVESMLLTRRAGNAW